MEESRDWIIKNWWLAERIYEISPMYIEALWLETRFGWEIEAINDEGLKE